jgi:hypothetical protein
MIIIIIIVSRNPKRFRPHPKQRGTVNMRRLSFLLCNENMICQRAQTQWYDDRRTKRETVRC